MGSTCDDQPRPEEPDTGDTDPPGDGSLEALADALAALVAELAYEGRLSDLEEGHEDGDVQQVQHRSAGCPID
jgi:hypothetical protein